MNKNRKESWKLTDEDMEKYFPNLCSKNEPIEAIPMSMAKELLNKIKYKGLAVEAQVNKGRHSLIIKEAEKLWI